MEFFTSLCDMPREWRSKEDIVLSLEQMSQRLNDAAALLSDTATVSDYAQYTFKNQEGLVIWTAAFQNAINNHEIVFIPDNGDDYYIDQTVTIPSNRMIVASPSAHIKKVPAMNTLLLRNRHVHDGSHYPIVGDDKDCNIWVIGGIWEDTDPCRTLYHGMYDPQNSMPGIDACMFFNNIEGLTVKDVKIVQAGGFGIQVGNLTNAVIENITFEKTVADGVHLNGNTRNVIIKNIKGSVADDIVAFNMYDWQRSSVCFGPIENILCENIVLSQESPYKAIRILPGKYFYDDGSTSDCYIKDAIIRNVRGINTFKFYFQTPPYSTGDTAERNLSGWGDNIFIENVKTTLNAPIDKFDEYLSCDPVLGSFAVFEFGSFFGKIELQNIEVTLDKQNFPTAYFACIGPKSIRRNDKEIFDPETNSHIDLLVVKDVRINGLPLSEQNANEYMREIEFGDLYGEKREKTCGIFKKIVVL